MKASDTLLEAKSLIADPSKWCQESMGEWLDETGETTGAFEDEPMESESNFEQAVVLADAHQRCVIGALKVAAFVNAPDGKTESAGHRYENACYYLGAVVPGYHFGGHPSVWITSYNDTSEHGAVVDLLDKAVGLARTRGD